MTCVIGFTGAFGSGCTTAAKTARDERGFHFVALSDVINVKGKSSDDIANELNQAVGQKDLDAIIDRAGAVEMIQLGFKLLSISGHYADVGLVGDRIDCPLFARVHREQTFHGSFWTNYTDLSEVMALATENKIRHVIKVFKFEQINEQLDLLRKGEVVGRGVMKF